jgi:sugar phosphate isomerase/epimerase
MGTISRRTLLGSSALAVLGAHAARGAAPRLKIGVTDWNLKMGANPDAVPLAARIGFEGIQVSFGRRLVNDRMPADDPEIVARYLRLSKENKIPIISTCVDRLHDNGLKNDRLAVKWVQDGIRLTRELHASVLLLPFFGRCEMKTREEMDAVGDALRDLAPEAEKAGVLLALEDTVSAENNARIIERSRSKSVRVYYDTQNPSQAGFDVVKEIRWLGKDRICEFHFKDNPHYLGEGPLPFPQIVDAIRGIGYTGPIVLETDVHPGATVEADMRRNLDAARKLIGA